MRPRGRGRRDLSSHPDYLFAPVTVAAEGSGEGFAGGLLSCRITLVGAFIGALVECVE
jgi:hypothetical protein